MVGLRDSADTLARNTEAETPVSDGTAIPPSRNPLNGPESTGVSALTQDSIARAIDFFSTASSEILGACVVGFGACTYWILGRLGLILIGVICGIFLHATWEGSGNNEDGQREKRRREGSLEIARRLLEWKSRANGNEDLGDAKNDVLLVPRKKNFEGFQPEIKNALEGLVEAVVRDYVSWWYTPILPMDQSFPAACRQTLTGFLSSISFHLSRKRPADTFLNFLTNSSSIMIVFLSELSSALANAPAGTATSAEAVSSYLRMNPDSSLANVLNEKQQAKKFKMIAEDILQTFLDKGSYGCDPMRMFLSEILSGTVLEKTLQMCSRPEFINGWIVYLLEEGSQELMNTFDVEMSDETMNSLANTDSKPVAIGANELHSDETIQTHEQGSHRRQLSKAEEAMEEAMQEAKRLSQLIAEEEAMKETLQTLQDVREPSTITGDHSATKKDEDDHNGSSAEAPLSTAPEPPSQATTTNGVAPAASPATSSRFTSFDQLAPELQVEPESVEPEQPRRVAAPLTLHNATISIFDDAQPGDKNIIRSKPTVDYLVQIEPASSVHPGWMIVRKYADFETLHEVIRRISVVSGVTAFTEKHRALPPWKGHTKASLREELEGYLRDALWYRQLAESEGMKRFLEKDRDLSRSSTGGSKSGFPGLGWPTPAAFETMGKGMLDALASAPKGAAEGSKAVIGGVTGVFGGIGSLGQKKVTTNTNSTTSHSASRSSISALTRTDSSNDTNQPWGRESTDSLRTSSLAETQPAMIHSMVRRPSHQSSAESDYESAPASARMSMSSRTSMQRSRDASREPSLPDTGTPVLPVPVEEEELRLPPRPSDISDDYGSPTEMPKHLLSCTENTAVPSSSSNTPTTTPPDISSPSRTSPSTFLDLNSTHLSRAQPFPPRTRVTPPPLSEAETRVAVELFFAIITSLYTLSSAWGLRRTLLTAAKTYLLRPGNPSLESIRVLLQDSVIVANTTDAGLAYHLRKLRENALPTEEELRVWEAGGGKLELDPDEKRELAAKARKLLVERGMPVALTSVMGQAATGEALGKVWDFLQVEEVSRGLVFGLLLQAVRAITQ